MLLKEPEAMFSRSRKNNKAQVHYVHVPRKNQNYLPMIIFTMLITLIICISVDHVPVDSKKKITGSRVVKMIDGGIQNFHKRVSIAKKKMKRIIHEKTKSKKSRRYSQNKKS